MCTGTVGGIFLSLSPWFSCIVVKLHGNSVLRSVILLLLSILILYCLFGNTSTMTPLLDHLRCLLPAWFCTMILSPSSRGASFLTWEDRLSWALAELLARASSLHSAKSCHVLDKSLVLPSSGMRRVYFLKIECVPYLPEVWLQSCNLK